LFFLLLFESLVCVKIVGQFISIDSEPIQCLQSWEGLEHIVDLILGHEIYVESVKTRQGGQEIYSSVQVR
jgi:hypothetical protein